jgi:hypothetical protein
MMMKMKMMHLIKWMTCLIISFGTRIWRIWSKRKTKQARMMIKRKKRKLTWGIGKWTSRISWIRKRRSWLQAIMTSSKTKSRVKKKVSMTKTWKKSTEMMKKSKTMRTKSQMKTLKRWKTKMKFHSTETSSLTKMKESQMTNLKRPKMKTWLTRIQRLKIILKMTSALKMVRRI